MVSPLSSRLVTLTLKAKIKSSTASSVNASNSKIPWHIENRRKRISGYTADGERSGSQAVNAEKQLRADQVEAHAKKRKIEEKNFQAHNVKNDLAKAGIEYSPRSRALPVGTIDMSKVELVMSSKYKPEQHSQTNGIGGHDQEDISALYSTETFASLISSTRHFYNGRRKKFRSSSQRVENSESVTSTTTMNTSPSESPFDSGSEDENTPMTKFVLPGTIEEVKDYKIHSTVAKVFSLAEGKMMDLERALVCSSMAR